MTEPTDNELDIVLSKHWPAFATMGTLPLIWTRAAFREAIAKWGTPPRISESDTDYWVRNRALILRAIEERGFRLVSSGGLFWLSGAAPPTAQAEGWRPIETAPKDGTRVLLLNDLREFGSDRVIVEAMWRTASQSAWWSCPVRGGYIGENPTHWMPLPEPPK